MERDSEFTERRVGMAVERRIQAPPTIWEYGTSEASITRGKSEMASSQIWCRISVGRLGKR
jgi:hypothetical protein